MPCGVYLRASGVMMFFSLKEVLSHRCKVLFVTHASEMSRRGMMAKSPLGLPRFGRTTSSCPHTSSTIVGVRASTPSIKREKHARMHASARLSVGSLRE